MPLPNRAACRGPVALLAVLTIIAVSGCGGPDSSTPAGQAAPTSASTDSLPSTPVDLTSPSPSTITSTTTTFKRVFPVVGRASYARTHHDYPASDIIAPCGATALAPIDATVLEVNRVDSYDPKVNAGATRGGLSVSMLGGDGVRYYGSHYRSINQAIQPGTRVRAGEPIAIVGDTGDAGACHIHFGLSPPCTKADDWWIRRGVIWPWPYLDSWRTGGDKSPADEIGAWHKEHGCPTTPLAP